MNTETISHKLVDDLVKFLRRDELDLNDQAKRKRILGEAFDAIAPKLLQKIDYSGSWDDASYRIISTLMKLNMCKENTHTLERLLKVLREDTPAEHVQRLADELIKRIQSETDCTKTISTNTSKTHLILENKYEIIRDDYNLEYPRIITKVAIDCLHDKKREVLVEDISEISLDERNYLSQLSERLVLLEHQNILPVYFFDQDNLRYVIYQLTDAEQLSSNISYSRPARVALQIIRQVANALEHLHSQGIVHGNLNTRNILIDKDNYVYVTHVGYNQKNSDGQNIAVDMSNEQIFFAPEQLNGEAATIKSDIYSIGLITYTLLCGKYPFVDQKEYSRSLDNNKPLPQNTYINDTFYKLIEQACHHSPHKRFSSVNAFIDAFQSVLEQGTLPSTERKQEQEYLSILIQDCNLAVRGFISYIDLRGIFDKTEASESSKFVRTPIASIARKYPIRFQATKTNESKKERTTESIRDVIMNPDTKKTILLGAPGSGKTTTLIQLALDLGLQAQTNSSKLIPIFIPLNLFDGSISFEQFIIAQTPYIGHQLKEYISSNKVLLMFDALNETPNALKPQIIEFLNELDHFVVSCRVKDYENELKEFSDLTKIQVLPLNPVQIKKAMIYLSQEESNGLQLWTDIGGNDNLLRFWQKTIQHKDTDLFWKYNYEKTPEYTTSDEDSAWKSMHRIGILPICQNPFIMRMVCDLYFSGGTIPTNKGELFKTFVNNLLTNEISRIESISNWTEEERSKKLEFYEKTTKDTLIKIAGIIQRRELGAGVAESYIRKELIDKDFSETLDLALQTARDANLIRLEADQIVFSHQLIQEYFASQVIGLEFDKSVRPSAKMFFKSEEWWRPNGWEETIIIFAGVRGSKQIEEIVKWIADAQPEIAVRCITESGLTSISIKDLSVELKEWLSKKWLSIILSEEQPLFARANAARALSQIGDPRIGIGIKNKLPTIEWLPTQESKLLVSKYPITVVQYNAFKETGYSNENFWKYGLYQWHMANKIQNENDDIYDNYPIVNVTWYEAKAFCEWLSEKTGEKIRLPTEKEWLHISKSEIFEYSWKEASLNGKGNINYDENSLNMICSVGLFSFVSTTHNVVDLNGNVWEWCEDIYAYDSIKTNIKFENSVRILHGGSWKRKVDYARSKYRFWSFPNFRDDDIGFRIVMEKD